MKERSFHATFEEQKVLGAISQDAMQTTPRKIGRDAVELVEKFGSASYGEAWKGMLDESSVNIGSIPAYLVAVKTTVSNRTAAKRTGFARAFTRRHSKRGAGSMNDGTGQHSGVEELEAEAVVMAHVGAHKNLVSLIGVVTAGMPYMLVMSFCEHGPLDKLLQAHGAEVDHCRVSVGDSSDTDNSNTDAQVQSRQGLVQHAYGSMFSAAGRVNIMLQTAQGMAHLARNFVHRDLRAGNVLVDSAFVCRVADFGLSRLAEKAAAEGDGEDAEEEQIYASTTGTFPVRSTAPEAMTEARFTQASDVWSWGILGVEVYTNGARPFDEWSNTELPGKICSGLRPQQPPMCSDPIFKMLTKCWNEAAADRPDFDSIVQHCRRIANRPTSMVSLAGIVEAPPVAPRSHISVPDNDSDMYVAPISGGAVDADDDMYVAPISVGAAANDDDAYVAPIGPAPPARPSKLLEITSPAMTGDGFVFTVPPEPLELKPLPRKGSKVIFGAVSESTDTDNLYGDIDELDYDREKALRPGEPTKTADAPSGGAGGAAAADDDAPLPVEKTPSSVSEAADAPPPPVPNCSSYKEMVLDTDTSASALKLAVVMPAEPELGTDTYEMPTGPAQEPRQLQLQ